MKIKKSHIKWRWWLDLTPCPTQKEAVTRREVGKGVSYTARRKRALHENVCITVTVLIICHTWTASPTQMIMQTFSYASQTVSRTYTRVRAHTHTDVHSHGHCAQLHSSAAYQRKKKFSFDYVFEELAVDLIKWSTLKSWTGSLLRCRMWG